MKISIFKNSYNIWIDYSKLKDCLWVFEVTEIEKDQIEKWCNYEIIDDKLIISETAEYLENIKQEKIAQINNDFEKKINDYNSKYTKTEQERFSDKSLKANIVKEWWNDPYITAKAKSLWISAEQYATLIIQKAEAFEVFYTEAEIERDQAISIL